MGEYYFEGLCGNTDEYAINPMGKYIWKTILFLGLFIFLEDMERGCFGYQRLQCE
jgi:hypothetical protein